MSEETIFDHKVTSMPQDGAMNSDETVHEGLQKLPGEETSTKALKKKGIGKESVIGAMVGAALVTPIALFPDAPDDGNDIDSIAIDDKGQEAPQVSVPHLVGHDMDVATGVDDSMSFNQAFATARHEVGAGGIFVWHGHSYGTYYANEWNAMTPDEQNQYWADVHHTTSQIANEQTQDDPILEQQAEPDPNQLADNQGQNDNQGEGENEGNVNENPTEPEPLTNLGEGEPTEPEPEPEPEPVPGPEPPVGPGEGIAGNGEEPGIEEPIEPSAPEEPIAVENPDEVLEPVDPEPYPSDPIDEPEPLVLADEDVIAEFDLNGDEIPDTAYVDANGNEIVDVVLDTTGDGSYDTLVIDPEVDEDGNLMIAEENIVEIGGVEIDNELDVADAVDDELIDDDEVVDVDSNSVSDDIIDDNTIAENPDVDDFASLAPDPDVTIDNNMDMSDFS